MDDHLTPREIEVVKLIACGDTDRAIAVKLGITLRTARCHRANLMGKLGAHETTSLVRFAIRTGLIQA